MLKGITSLLTSIAVFFILLISEAKRRSTSFSCPVKVAFIAVLLASIPIFVEGKPKKNTDCSNSNESITFDACDYSTKTYLIGAS